MRKESIAEFHSGEFHSGFNGAALFQVRKDDAQSVLRRAVSFRFNGAALFQVRKAPLWTACGMELSGFNGAALFQVRKAVVADAMGAGRGSFNGAALFQVRKVDFNSSKLVSLRRFNGAALFQVRKGRTGNEPHMRLAIASMGPHSFKCGKLRSSLTGE